ncbi:MAG: cytochrome c [Chloroflexi bacterium]|nr:cytochrome c [Chloroflexota bacterium]
MPGKRVNLLIVSAITTLFVIAACSEEVIPTQAPIQFNPTAAAPIERSDTSDKVSESVEDAPIVSEGDADAGQILFNGSGCTGCHSTDGSQIVGPSLLGVYERSGTRTALDADAYIAQSVREPTAFVVDGFPAVMPSFDLLSESDVKNVIAYLKTLK